MFTGSPQKTKRPPTPVPVYWVPPPSLCTGPYGCTAKKSGPESTFTKRRCGGATKNPKVDAEPVSVGEPSIAQQYEDVNVKPSHSRTNISCTPQATQTPGVPARHDGLAAMGQHADTFGNRSNDCAHFSIVRHKRRPGFRIRVSTFTYEMCAQLQTCRRLTQYLYPVPIQALRRDTRHVQFHVENVSIFKTLRKVTQMCIHSRTKHCAEYGANTMRHLPEESKFPVLLRQLRY